VRFIDQKTLLKDREKSLKVKVAFMKQMSNLKQKGRRLELMHLVEMNVIDKIDQELKVKLELENDPKSD
jgi:hypothetical protein